MRPTEQDEGQINNILMIMISTILKFIPTTPSPTAPLFMKWYLLLLIPLILLKASLHEVEEGHVGVYFRGGALLDEYSEPGFNWKMPGTSVDLVQVTVQTDKVLNIPCGTSGGVLVTFESIEVVNRLKKDMVIPMIRKYGLNYDKIWIFDKIHHEINQFCSKHTLHDVYIQLFDTMDENLSKALQIDVDKWAPGLEIIAARVTKPTIPSGIANNFVRMEEENTNLLIRTEEQKVAQLESETEQRVSIIQAEKAAAVMRIHMEKEILNKHMERKVSQINDEMNSGIQTAKADAASYRSQKLAENNVEIMTPQYRQNLLYENLRQQKKIFFGSTLDSLWS